MAPMLVLEEMSMWLPDEPMLPSRALITTIRCTAAMSPVMLPFSESKATMPCSLGLRAEATCVIDPVMLPSTVTSPIRFACMPPSDPAITWVTQSSPMPSSMNAEMDWTALVSASTLRVAAFSSSVFAISINAIVSPLVVVTTTSGASSETLMT